MRSSAGDTGDYYDRLSWWTAVARVFGYGGGRAHLTVHRALADPRADGRPTVTRVHDLLCEVLPPLTHAHVLDAGCGMGGTMLDLAARGSGTFTGVTLSPEQARVGRRAIARAKLADRVRILVQSYDSLLADSFDVAIAIESLAHSPDPRASLAAIAGRLAPGGWLAIVDDLPVPAARGTQQLAALQRGWRLPLLWTADELLAALGDEGLTLVENRDLSAALRPRTRHRIVQLDAANRIARRLALLPSLREVLDSHHGGLALERLYRDGLMQYRLVVARRGPARRSVV